MTRTPFRPTIRTQADLEEAWRHLIRPLGFDNRSLWLMLICDDDQPLPQLTELGELPAVPSSRQRREFGRFLGQLAAMIPDARLAFLLTRPGAGSPDDRDRSWATMLYDVARDLGVPCEVVHLATDEMIAPIPLDALDLSRSAVE